MPATRGGIAGGVSIILLGAGAFLVHNTTRGSASAWLGGAVAAIQISLIGWMLSYKWATHYRVAIGFGIAGTVAAFFIASDLPVRVIGIAVSGGCHAVAYASLLVWFGLSLRAGHEPVVTGFARRLRQSMPDKVVRYTRHVTLAWCVFFAAQLLLSAALLLVAPEPVWSAFVNLLNLPLLIAMVLAEFGCRLILFRHEAHTGLIATLSAMRRTRLAPASRP